MNEYFIACSCKVFFCQNALYYFTHKLYLNFMFIVFVYIIIKKEKSIFFVKSMIFLDPFIRTIQIPGKIPNF